MIKIIQVLFTSLLIFHASSAIWDNPLLIYYTVTNTAQTPVRVYRPGGPLEGIFYSDYVSVRFQGNPLRRHPHYPSISYWAYGPELPRVSERAFVLLNPGESMTSSIDIANQFDFTKVGTYHVEMNPSKQFEIQDLLDSGQLVIEECQDYQVRVRNQTRRYLNYVICGFEEDTRKIQQEFQRNFIRMPRLPIELPCSLSLAPKGEQVKTEPVVLNNNDVPSFGLLGSASLVIEITSENIPHGRNLDTNFTLSCCHDDDHHEYRYGIRDSDFYVDEDSEYEGLECSEFLIWKYRRTMELKRLIGRFEDFVQEIKKSRNGLRKLFKELWEDIFNFFFLK